jgi:hypothetical protein
MANNQNIFQRIGNIFRRNTNTANIESELKQQMSQYEKKQR